MADTFAFQLLHSDGAARAGLIHTPRGTVRTPAFVPVGTRGALTDVHGQEVPEAAADIVLVHTYHLMLRPGPERIAALGGLHRFINWPHPILTDSGGFQVMSLAELRKVDENGVVFRSHLDGAIVALTPERAIEIQALLGSDIAMQLDECLRLPAEPAGIARATPLSLRWAERCKRAQEKYSAGAPGRALFGIVQGGDDKGLRAESARALVDTGFDGYAIGGLAVGEEQSVMLAMVEAVMPHLPADKPHYLMGVGTPEDILETVPRAGAMFDCVLPTRNGRHGLAFTRHGPINLKNARHADDPRPLDAESRCQAAREFSRAYLHHLVKANESMAGMLLSLVNLFYYQDLMQGARDAIAAGNYNDFRDMTREGWARGDIAPDVAPM